MISGGARSGKSSYGESLLEKENDVLYIATARAEDNEMKDRVKIHQERRNDQWTTFEGYKDISQSIQEILKDKTSIFLDCITLLVSNFFVYDFNVNWDNPDKTVLRQIELAVFNEIEDLIELSEDFDGDFIVVTNEVGLGIVPSTPLGRIYRDVAGKVNMKIASAAQEVHFVVSGIPMKIKG